MEAAIKKMRTVQWLLNQNNTFTAAAPAAVKFGSVFAAFYR